MKHAARTLFVVSPFVVLALASASACGSSSDATTAGLGGADEDTGTIASDGSASTSDGSVRGSESDGSTGTTTDASSTNDDASGGATFDAAACAYPYQCPMSHDLGSLSGDTSPSTGNSYTLTGSTSDWITVHLTEDDHSALGKPMSVRATLTSAPGTNFDLYLYRNDGSATVECKVVNAMSTFPGNVDDQVSDTWGEGTVANASDDSAIVTLRVQHISGPCDLADAWKLVVVGNAK